MGRPDDAQRTYRRAIALRAHYWATYNWLGAYYYREARFPKASAMFRQVISLAPDSVRGYSNLGGSYLEESRYAEAIVVSEKSIAIQAADYGYSNLGSVYFFLKRYEEADKAYLEALKLSPQDLLLWWNLGDGYYWTPGKRDQSIGPYKKCETIDCLKKARASGYSEARIRDYPNFDFLRSTHVSGNFSAPIALLGGQSK
jgi:tetratricopeptide (TPR) repeat protein